MAAKWDQMQSNEGDSDLDLVGNTEKPIPDPIDYLGRLFRNERRWSNFIRLCVNGNDLHTSGVCPTSHPPANMKC